MLGKLCALIVAVLGAAVLGVAVLTTALSCAASADGNVLIKRASFDLGCPSSQLSWVKIDDRTWGVQGCSKRATYIESCDGPRGNYQTRCTWVMNNRAKR